MTFQKAVNYDQGFGIPGEVVFDGPQRAQPSGVINSAVPANNVVGRVFSRTADANSWRAGDTDADGAQWCILSNPKAYAAVGTVAGGTLAPTLIVPNGTIGEMMQMGIVCVVSTTAAKVGYIVRFVKTTGALVTVAPGTAADALHMDLPGAVVDRFNQPTPGAPLAIRMTQ